VRPLDNGAEARRRTATESALRPEPGMVLQVRVRSLLLDSNDYPRQLHAADTFTDKQWPVIVLAIAINLMLSMTIFQIFDRPARNPLRHAVAFKRRRWRAAINSVVAILATFVFAIPILIMIATRGDHLAFAHEALAFCYFATIRILNGEGGEIWLLISPR
jgi:hypothetical protein